MMTLGAKEGGGWGMGCGDLRLEKWWPEAKELVA